MANTKVMIVMDADELAATDAVARLLDVSRSEFLRRANRIALALLDWGTDIPARLQELTAQDIERMKATANINPEGD